ncbi:MAG: hypothetical protein R3190_08525, partial [Thermoanaerobaculia bacterium]|nr:hypothetical protein [Thermoanaerobaculia bacterium]
MRRAPRRSALLLLLAAAAVGAQTVDFSGTWRLDHEASAIDAEVPYAGLGGSARVPRTLYTTEARNGTLIVGSDMNTSHARTYRHDATDVTSLAEAELVLSARREGNRWTARGASADVELEETLTRDGESLRVEITLRSGGSTRS